MHRKEVACDSVDRPQLAPRYGRDSGFVKTVMKIQIQKQGMEFFDQLIGCSVLRKNPGKWSRLLPVNFCLFVFGPKAPQWARASLFMWFLYQTQRRTTVGRTPLDEWAARRRDLYLTKHNTHNRQTSVPQWDSNQQSQQASDRRPTP